MTDRNAFDNGIAQTPVKEMSEKEKKWLDEEIDVEFYNTEEPGLMNTFCYGNTKNFKKYTLMHGGKYKLPRKVCQHIESRNTPVWSWQPDGQGRMIKKQVSTKPRFQCRQVFA
jgi:hypothetical protein